MTIIRKKTMMNRIGKRAALLTGAAALLLAATVSTASAETLMMPTRDARTGTNVVVWGVTTQPNGTPFSLDCGGAPGIVAGSVGDRSYINRTCNYLAPGLKTATLTVGAEVATVEIQAFDPAAFVDGGAAGDNNRSLGINMAIQDGLRNLWVTQSNRTTFNTNVTTNWGGSFAYAGTSLVALAFENHGYRLANDGSAPTGLYEKYVVRRGLNYVMSNISNVTLGVTPQGDDPCVGVSDGPAPCVGFRMPSDPGYSIPLAMLPFAASGALARVNTEVGGVTAGKTYGEILQRLVNAEAWGQTDGVGNIRRGGVGYQLNGGQFDGSTAGWAILGFLDAAAAGAIVPPWVSTEFKFGFDNSLNNDGSFDYSANANPASNSNVGPAKVGIGLQGLFFNGEFAGPRVAAVTNNINSWWPGAVPFGIGGNVWGGHTNHGGAYAMFNMFKGLKLHGINTLPAVNRSTRSWAKLGATGVEDDWHADYQDWLIATQNASGSFGPAMSFSCCYSNDNTESAIALLILSPVALVLPDEEKFAAFGLSPATDTKIELNSHTVTATAESTGGTPVPGATVNFTILTGPNTGLTGTDTTDSNGEATFTYTDAGPLGTVGTDTIQASIGNLNSNIVEMIWEPNNQPPVAVDDAVSTDEDVAVTFSVVGNDTDPDGNLDPATAVATSSPTNGTLVDNGSGSFTYTPNLNYNGPDSFTYQVCDTDGVCDNATVLITVVPVNDPPVCVATPSKSTLWPPKNKMVSISINGVTDPVEGDPVTVTVTSIAQDETIGNSSDGSGVGSSTANVRAQRDGGGNGRVYHISYTGDDGNGGICTGEVTVGVPHDQGNGSVPVDGGSLYDSVSGATLP
jgi:hypothetical protein